MSVTHSSLTGANLHEPKGAAAAANNTAFIANGSGSGSFSLIPSASLAAPEDFKRLSFSFKFEDVSTASSQWVASPVGGTIVGIFSVIDGALGTADVTLSFELSGTAITDGNIVITQSSSAAGDADSSTPTANNTVTQGQAIELISDGASTNTVDATVTFLVVES